MTTIIINERTKVGKTLLELANLLAINNKDVIIDNGIDKPSVKTDELTPKQRTLINRLKKIKKNADAGLYEKQTLKNFYDNL